MQGATEIHRLRLERYVGRRGRRRLRDGFGWLSSAPGCLDGVLWAHQFRRLDTYTDHAGRSDDGAMKVAARGLRVRLGLRPRLRSIAAMRLNGHRISG
jgi:hypothetical protein